MKNFITFRYFRSDVLGGVTAGIVALPLALAFGEQSGLGAAAGLYGAAFIAFFAALFGGTPTQISGPTAPMTAFSMVIVAGLIQTSGGQLDQALPIILLVFLMAGLIQILLGVFRLGTFIRYIPYTVVSGFMTGIGGIILITQLPPTLGYYAAKDQEVVDSFLPHAEEVLLDRILKEKAQDGILDLDDIKETIERGEHMTEEDIKAEATFLAANDARGVYGSLEYLPRALSRVNFTELLLTLLTVGIIYAFRRVTKAIPSELVALLAVASGAYALGLDYVLIRQIPTGLPEFHLDILSSFDLVVLAPYFMSALLLALLGAIDSLLTSVVADNLTKTQHQPNQELIGQGIGNGIAAFFGGLPGAGATIRTVVNIQAGGKSKLSGMTAGTLLFVILIVLGPLASKIPAAVLAGILITVGFGVMDYKGLKALPKMEMSDKVILIVVFLLTVFWQLVYAVGLGLVLAAVLFFKRMSDVSADQVVISDLNQTQEEERLWEDEITISPEIRKKVILKHLSGPMFFGIVADFRDVVSALSDLRLLVIRMEKVPFIDQSGLYALEAAIEELNKADVIVALSGPNDQAMGLLRSMNIIPDLLSERHVFKDFSDCTRWLREVLEKENGLEEELKILKRG